CARDRVLPGAIWEPFDFW
nr:immunoglobulin heavy chain junction region [Macaca mulatta]MOW76926.1 immunoglobulin heavy chain junction region [Macaca mulatta]MOW80630.1 immunoglobulin heavy chain junction region [Macaca mulatta]MOW80739.1 immunoglobulin heavy chain junction region [Macaca mulatta]MOW81225.1 immunoglobulin heavy chain junction region [Macaca mulatta]